MKRPAAAATQNAEKKPATSVAERASGAYLTHDNGGRPFKVVVDWPDGSKATIQVFKVVQNEESYDEKACISFSAERVFVGRSPEHGRIFDGNSLLLHVEGLKYIFVGHKIFSFTAKSMITEYVSPVGNNDVPYPWALDEQGWRYLMIENCILGSKLFEKVETLESDYPYTVYYEQMHITPDTSTCPPREPAVQFQGITAFFHRR
mmetsp:Transcript_14067/g.26288  ORF Transcript_14067/g.26288 Transcript_14067/m.26288 type:complete len:205 (+) Transcript_14067:37-651(+)